MGGNSDWRTFTASDWLRQHSSVLVQSIVEQNVAQCEFRTERVRNFSSQPEPCIGQRVEWEIVMPWERESKGSREIDRKSVRQRERSSARDGKMSTCLTAKMSVWVATLEGFKTWELMRQHLVRWEISFPSLPFSVLFSFLFTLHRHARTYYKYVCIYTVCVQWKWPCSRQSFLNFCNVHVFVSFVWERELLKATNGCQLDSSILLWVEISFGFTGSLCYFSFYSVYFPGSGSGSGIGLLTQ